MWRWVCGGKRISQGTCFRPDWSSREYVVPEMLLWKQVVDPSKIMSSVCVGLTWYGVVSIPSGMEPRLRGGQQELIN